MTSFDKAFQTVCELVERFKKGIDYYTSPAYQESEARQDFIDDFFIALGWDVRHREQQNPYEQEVKIEKSQKQQDSRAQKRADYAFYFAPNYNDVVFFAEAKKPAVGLRNVDHYFQTIKYGWNATTDVAILTDFEELHIIDCRFKPDIRFVFNGHHKVYKFTDYLDKDKYAEIYWVFSKEGIANKGVQKYVDALPKPKGKIVQSALFKGGYQPIDESFLEFIDAKRETIAKAFKKNDVGLQSEELTEAVQRTIDRLVFIRFLEDKSIEPHGHVNEWKNWKDFVSDCRKLDAKYNGVVFKKHFIDDENFVGADERLFKEICNEISDLNSPYDFNYIPVHILGSIYERFLGKIVVSTEKRVTIEEKPEVRKAGGVYYTPKFIVDYIVKKTIGTLIEGKTPKEIANLRFADIACGSGSFLIGVYDYLLEYHKKYYAGKLSDKVEIDRRSEDFGNVEFKDKEWRLTLRLKQQVLLNNIYGVDIDPQAVEVTQLSLFLKMLEDETLGTTQIRQGAIFSKVLPDLSKNIVSGNSLIGTEILDTDLFSFQNEKKLNPLDFETAFPHIIRNGGFDAIIGNPPYVRQEFLSEQKIYFEKNYSVYHGMADLYVYFLERGISLIKKAGFFGVIVANKWMRSSYGEPLRKWLKSQQLVEIIDFGDLPVFKGATTYPCILICKPCLLGERKATAFSAVNVESLSFESLETYIDSKKTLIKFSSLEELGWNLVSDAENNLLKKIAGKGLPLSKYSENKIYYGIKTGLNEAFIVDETKRNILIQQDAKSAEIIKPFLGGRDIKRYQSTKNRNYLIFTRRGVKLDDYPAIKKYLEGYKEQLLPKPTNWKGKEWKGRKPGNYQWYELQDAVDYYIEFEKPKIILPDIALRMQATYDSNKNYCVNTAYIIPLDDKYLLGILNSNLIQFIYTKISSSIRGGYLRFIRQYLESLPIVDRPDKQSRARLVSLVTQILLTYEQLAISRTERDISFLQHKTQMLDKAIDKLVYEIYDLTNEEIAIIEKQ